MCVFRQGDFSLKDESRAERPEKIETDELQALLDINSTQTKKELAEQLGVTQQAISVRIKIEFYKKSSELFCTPNNKISSFNSLILGQLLASTYFFR